MRTSVKSTRRAPRFCGVPVRSTKSPTYSTETEAQSQLTESDSHHVRPNPKPSHFSRARRNRPLPLPPVLDAVAITAKTKYRQPKPRLHPSQWTPFQERLNMNPWANILATPVRFCDSTQVRLPAFFHVTLHPTAHPETGDPWLLPRDLLAPGAPPRGHPVRILARRWLLARRSRGEARGRTVPYALHKFLGPRAGKVVWREDMADVVLETLRAKVHGKLRWCLVYPKAGFIKRCDGGVMDIMEEEGGNIGRITPNENNGFKTTSLDGSSVSSAGAQGVMDIAEEEGNTARSVIIDENKDVETNNLDGPRIAPTRAQLRESKKPQRPAAILYLVPLSLPAVANISESLRAIDNELANAAQTLQRLHETGRNKDLNQLLQTLARRREIDLTPGTVLQPAKHQFPVVWISDISRTTDEQYDSVLPRKREEGAVLTSTNIQTDMPADEQTYSQDEGTVEENNEGIKELPDHDQNCNPLSANGQAELASGQHTKVFLDAEEARRAGKNDARPVPVYDLPELLGAEGVRQLIEGTVFEDARCLVLKESSLSMAAQLALFKLQYYLVDDHV